jgi:hypothetical protein
MSVLESDWLVGFLTVTWSQPEPCLEQPYKPMNAQAGKKIMSEYGPTQPLWQQAVASAVNGS